MIQSFDIKYSLRRLITQPKFTAITIFVMAFGVGLTLFLYSQIHVMEQKALPFADGNKIVTITRHQMGYSRITGGVHNLDMTYFKDKQQSLNHFGGYEDRRTTIATDGMTDEFNGAATSSQLFSLTNTQPLIGRTLIASDDPQDAPRVIVLGYRVWQDYFGGQESIIGTILNVNGDQREVVGVMPENFKFPVDHQVWLNYFIPNNMIADGEGWNTGFGKLKEGVSLAQAKNEFDSLSDDLQRQYPEIYKEKTSDLRPYTLAFSEPSSYLISLIKAAAVCIFLLAIINVGNLLLVRGIENTREHAIRSAIGAPKWRIIFLQIIESFWICAVAGALGILIAKVTLNFLDAQITAEGAPFWWQFKLYGVVIAVALSLIVASWLLTSFLPSLLMSRQPLSEILQSGSKGGGSFKENKIVGVFVSFEVLFAFFLLTAAGMSIVAMFKSLNADYGAATEGYLTAEVQLPKPAYPTLADRNQYYIKLEQAIKLKEGVEDITFTGGLPGYPGSLTYFNISERDLSNGGAYPGFDDAPISDNFFELMEIPLIEGRFFNPSDTEHSPKVVIIDDVLAESIWPGESAIGKQIQLHPAENGEWVTVVGVVKEVIHGPPLRSFGVKLHQVYRPMEQVMPYWFRMQMAVKVAGDPNLYVEKLKNAGLEADPEIALTDIVPLSVKLDRHVNRFRTLVYTFMPIAFIALVLAASGIYGVMSRLITQRTNEIGLRRALGAKNKQIYSLFFKQALRYLYIGLGFGGVLAFWVLPQVFLKMIPSNLQIVFSIAAVVMVLIVLVAIIATYFPSRRAITMTPSNALYHE